LIDISDNHIVKQIRQGNIEAYSEIVQRYQKRIFNLMYRFSQSKPDAAELTQDVFCKAYDKLSSFNNNRSFFSWLYTLAMNHGKDWNRQQLRKRDGLRLYADSLQDESQSSTDTTEKQQEISLMLTELSNLPPEKSELVMLRYQQDLSISELGEIFNLSDSAVKMRIHRTLEVLQNKLIGVLDENQTD
jgi:RNA polymerase sigma-70 factor (ECF subfamily)